MTRELKFLQLREQKKDQLLQAMIDQVPYIKYLGVKFDRLGDELTAQLNFKKELIGNPAASALHGGAIGSFLEITAITELAWAINSKRVEKFSTTLNVKEDLIHPVSFVELPKTIDFTIDYLKVGLSTDAYARAMVNRVGRRYASVSVTSWQFDRNKPFAQALGHFLMPSQENE